MRIISILAAAVLLSMSQLALAQESTPLSRLKDLQLNNNIQLQLDDNKITSIMQGCSNAQKIVSEVSKRIDSAINKRQLLYGDIQKESKAIEIRLTRQGVDASGLDLFIGKNQQILEDMIKASNNFQTVSEDMVAINCQENPELFYTGLLTLRDDIEVLSQDDLKIYDIVKNANSDTFIPLADRLTL
jgi:hypothetical protein